MKTLTRIEYSSLTGTDLAAVFSDGTREPLPPGFFCHHCPADPNRAGRATEHYRIFPRDWSGPRRVIALPAGASAAAVREALDYLTGVTDSTGRSEP